MIATCGQLLASEGKADIPPAVGKACYRLMRWWRFFRGGQLPRPGGLLGQNPLLLELFDALDTIQAQKEADRLAEMEAKAKGTGRLNKTRPKRKPK